MKHDSIERDDDLRKLFQSVRVDDQDNAFKAQLRARLLTQAQARETAKSTQLQCPRKSLHLGRLVWAAAAVAVLAFGCWWMLGGGTGVASADLAAVIANVRAATSVSFWRDLCIPGQPKHRLQVYAVPQHVRIVSDDHVFVRDDERHVEVSLNLVEKKGVSLVSNSAGGIDRDFLDRLRRIHVDSGRLIGREMLDGHRTKIYEVAQNAVAIKIWADEVTEMPLRVEIRPSGTGQDGVVEVMTHFVWNEPIEPSLFSTELPAGYVLRVNGGPINEQSLIELLRVCVTLSDGAFPDTLDSATAANLVFQDFRRRLPDATTIVDEGESVRVRYEMDQIAKDAFRTCLKGLEFIGQVQQVQAWHYSGRGARLGDASRVVCYWGLPGDGSYRVIYGDLSLRSKQSE